MTRVRRATAAETDTVRRLLTDALLDPPPSLADTVAAGRVHVALGGASDDTRGAEPAVRDADATPRLVGCLVRLPPAETPDAGHVAATVETLPPERRPFDPAAWRDRTTATHVDSVAVARGRRGDGVGTALIAAAADAVDTGDAAGVDTSDPSPLTTAFRSAVRPFYDSLGFTVVSGVDDDRLVGWRTTGD